MSQAKSSGVDFIDPNVYYTIHGLARLLHKTPRWVRQELIVTGKVAVTQHKTLVLIPGWSVGAWVEEEMQCRDATDDENETTNRRSQSKS